MSIVWDHNIEAGNLTEFGGQSGSDISASASAAMAGTNYGLAVLCDDTTANYLYMGAGYSGTTGVYRWRFYIDPNSITMPTGTGISVFVLRYATGSTNLALVQLNKSGSTYYITAFLYNDAGGTSQTSAYAITDAPHYVEVKITRATGASTNDGSIQLWIDGTSKETISNVDNYTRLTTVENFRLGAIVKEAGTSGTFYLDEFVLNDDGGEIGAYKHDLTSTNITTGAPTLGAPTLESIGNADNLTATNIVTGAPTLGAPTVGIVYVIDDIILEWADAVHALTATNIITGTPTLGAPSIGQAHALTATTITTGAASVAAPTLGQKHALTSTSITTGPPILGTPTIGQVHALTATTITTATPVLGAPSMSGNAALTATNITTSNPVLGTPSIGQVHVLVSNWITTSTADMGLPSIGQVHKINAAGILTGLPILDAPTVYNGVMAAPASRALTLEARNRALTLLGRDNKLTLDPRTNALHVEDR